MRFILVIVILAVLGGAGYFLFKNDGDVKKAAQEVRKDVGGAVEVAKKEAQVAVDDVSGYPDAKTPKEAADHFLKAIKAREYDKAAKYCTDKYAEILRSGDKSARRLGKAIDDVGFQLEARSVLNDEMRQVLYGFDPFAKSITITVGKQTDTTAVATIAPEWIKQTGQATPFSTWKIDLSFWGAFTAGPMLVPLNIPIVKEGEVWKLNFPTPPAVQTSVLKLNDKAGIYVQKMEILSREIKNDADTKANAMKRMKELFEDAAKE